MTNSWLQVLLLAMIALAILVILLLVIYLIDRMNVLERETHQAVETMRQPAAPAGPYAGLSGKKLWDAMSGQPPEGLSSDVIDGVRERYTAVLLKHMASVFEEGRADVSRGLSSPPKSTRMVHTLRGQVESWLPGPAIQTLYQCGQEAMVSEPDQLAGIRQTLNAVSLELHTSCGLEVAGALGAQLLPPAEEAPLALAGEGAPPAAPAQPSTGPVAAPGAKPAAKPAT